MNIKPLLNLFGFTMLLSQTMSPRLFAAEVAERLEEGVGEATDEMTPSPTTKPTVKPTAKPTAKPIAMPTAKPTATPTEIPPVGALFTAAKAGNYIRLNGANLTWASSAPADYSIFYLSLPPQEGAVLFQNATCSIFTLTPTFVTTGCTYAGFANYYFVDCVDTTSVYSSFFCTNAVTMGPSFAPTTAPTYTPTIGPTQDPSPIPSIMPTVNPTTTLAPTPILTTSPSINPTVVPSVNPSAAPSVNPTVTPTAAPSSEPTTAAPSVDPTLDPTVSPSAIPTTATPSINPTLNPTADPSAVPTTATPSVDPTIIPSVGPTIDPTVNPSAAPTTAIPTILSSSVIPTSSSSSVSPTYVAPTHPTQQPVLRPPIATLAPVPISGGQNNVTSIPTAQPTANNRTLGVAHDSDESSSNSTKIIVGSVAAVGILTAVIATMYCCRKEKKHSAMGDEMFANQEAGGAAVMFENSLNKKTVTHNPVRQSASPRVEQARQGPLSTHPS